VLALETAQPLAAIVGPNAGDVYAPDAKPRNRIRLRPEIAKNGRARDIFLPDALVAKFRKVWTYMQCRREDRESQNPLF
jgi:hypothetical protein